MRSSRRSVARDRSAEGGEDGVQLRESRRNIEIGLECAIGEDVARETPQKSWGGPVGNGSGRFPKPTARWTL